MGGVVVGACRVFDGGVFCASAYKITGGRSIHRSAGSTVARAATHNFCRHLWAEKTISEENFASLRWSFQSIHRMRELTSEVRDKFVSVETALRRGAQS